MRVQPTLLSALLLTALAAAGPGLGHNDRDTREHSPRDDRQARDTERDRRDAERREREARDPSSRTNENASGRNDGIDRSTTTDTSSGDMAAKDSGTSTSGSNSSGSNSGSGDSGSGSNTSGSNSGSGDSGSGSNTSGSNSGSGDSGSGSNTSGSNSGSGDSGSGSNTSGSNSGSDDSGSGSNTSGSNSGSGDSGSGSNSSGSNSGSSSDDDDDDALIGSGTDAGRIEVETDPDGRERRRGEFLVRGDAQLADALQAAGFTRLSLRHLQNLDQSVLRVRIRDGSTLEADLATARTLQGATDAEPNYVFRLSGAAASAAGQARPRSATAGTGRNDPGDIHVGVIDTGVDTSAAGLSGRIGDTRAFGGAYTARAHGTHVAQILAHAGISVDVADVFQNDINGTPLATAESIARGIDWMAARDISVINVSITGPRSALLSDVVARATARGSIIVAAAGNDGPAAPPVYPAAFPDVVGVTAVDADGRIYRRANRGEYVDFAAFGVRVPVVGNGGQTEYVTGTSYAAPQVAAIIARRHRAQRPDTAAVEIGALRARAVDMGDRGRDPVFGWGMVSPAAR